MVNVFLCFPVPSPSLIHLITQGYIIFIVYGILFCLHLSFLWNYHLYSSGCCELRGGRVLGMLWRNATTRLSLGRAWKMLQLLIKLETKFLLPQVSFHSKKRPSNIELLLILCGRTQVSTPTDGSCDFVSPLSCQSSNLEGFSLLLLLSIENFLLLQGLVY